MFANLVTNQPNLPTGKLNIWQLEVFLLQQVSFRRLHVGQYLLHQELAGAMGATGAVGAMGATGAAGAMGGVGATGATGAVGAAGATGDVGAMRAVGAMGAAGGTA